MQLHYLLVVIVVSDVSDVEVMSSAVAVIFAITWLVNNCNIRTEPCFWTEPNRTKLIRNRIRLFQKPNQTEIKKSVFRTSLVITNNYTSLACAVTNNSEINVSRPGGWRKTYSCGLVARRQCDVRIQGRVVVGVECMCLVAGACNTKHGPVSLRINMHKQPDGNEDTDQ